MDLPFHFVYITDEEVDVAYDTFAVNYVSGVGERDTFNWARDPTYQGKGKATSFQHGVSYF